MKRLNKIKQLRHESGFYKAKELAIELGITSSAVISWEKQRAQPMSDNIMNLIKVLNDRRLKMGKSILTIDDLFEIV